MQKGSRKSTAVMPLPGRRMFDSSLKRLEGLCDSTVRPGINTSSEAQKHLTTSNDTVPCDGFQHDNIIHPHMEPYIDAVVSFLHKNRHKIPKLGAEDLPALLAVFSTNHSMANSGQKYEEFILGKPYVRRFTNENLVGLGAIMEETSPGEYDIKDIRTGELIDHYKYSSPGEDRIVYNAFVGNRITAEADRKGFGAIADLPDGMKKYTDGSVIALQGVGAFEGIQANRYFREWRDQERLLTRIGKDALSNSPAKCVTTDKFNGLGRVHCGDYEDYVLHYGSGPTTRNSRLVYVRSICVDPLWEGPEGMGFRGTHTKFHKALESGEYTLPGVPKYISSDACAHEVQKVDLHAFRARKTTVKSMNPDGTNVIVNDIVNYWRKPNKVGIYNGDMTMKMGVSTTLPDPLTQVGAVVKFNQRYTNAEIIIDICAPDRPPLEGAKSIREIFDDCGKIMLVANSERHQYTLNKTVPDRKYEPPSNMQELIDNYGGNYVYIRPPRVRQYLIEEIKEKKRADRVVDQEEYEDESVSDSTSILSSSFSTFGSTSSGLDC
jgi:hypothetical protein